MVAALMFSIGSLFRCLNSELGFRGLVPMMLEPFFRLVCVCVRRMRDREILTGSLSLSQHPMSEKLVRRNSHGSRRGILSRSNSVPLSREWGESSSVAAFIGFC